MANTNTPMMQQYQAIKDAHAGFLLFYRMGDFYELFGEDAITASSILGITLTQRRTNKDQEGLPMCGVPHHAAEGYIATLIEAGKKVALCDQTETPEEAKKRGGYKALVKRDVVRLFTGGTLTEDNLLTSGSHNYLLALSRDLTQTHLAWTDVSTGEVAVTTVPHKALQGELLRLNPAEILLAQQDVSAIREFWPLTKLTENDALFDTKAAEEDVQKTYGLQSLTPLGLTEDHAKGQTTALGALFAYIRLTQVGKAPRLQRPHIIQTGGHVVLDAATRRNLEITAPLHAATQRNKKDSSLLAAMNQTVTPAGSRQLATWLGAPLTDVNIIQKRQDAIALLVNNPNVRENIRTHLKNTADVARAVSRLTLERGGPRDMNAIRTTLNALPHLIQTLENAKGRSTYLAELLTSLSGKDALAAPLNAALKTDNELPLLARDGRFVQQGFCPKLDAERDLETNGNQKLAELEASESAATGLQLKLKYNKVWGRFFEVTKAQLEGKTIPEHFIHRQTTTGGQRFTTATLMDLEQHLSAASANALAREQEIFADLAEHITQNAEKIQEIATILATIDVLQSAAHIATRHNYTAPKIDTSNALTIEAGQHPVVANTVENFIPNSAELSSHQLWLITGPNMAGKSTYLRQTALIVLLAQVGFFVPATSAHIGVVDKIFCRIGASDDLAEGQSTFMVEMVETAHILSHATPKSLVILDEIGRGTATYDGLSIAWAVAEHLAATNKARGLFATHYHELTTLADAFPTVSNHHVAVKEWRGDIVFLHEVHSGAAPGSYGLHVAKLAGVPVAALKRAQSILSELESTKGTAAGDFPLFASEPPATNASAPINLDEKPSEVESKLVNIDLDGLSPRDAQNLLYDLKIMAAMASEK